MSAVLMSIRPEWCTLIASGKKTVEIRKTVPRKFVHNCFYGGHVVEPFKVYIYCTDPNTVDPHKYLETYCDGNIYKCNGKVFAEFVCEEVVELAPINRADDTIEEKACMNREEIVRYLKGKGYAWYISDLVIYDQPRELSEFYRKCEEYPACDDCEFCSWTIEEGYECVCDYEKPLKSPPQSWCYVEKV